MGPARVQMELERHARSAREGPCFICATLVAPELVLPTERMYSLSLGSFIRSAVRAGTQ